MKITKWSRSMQIQMLVSYQAPIPLQRCGCCAWHKSLGHVFFSGQNQDVWITSSTFIVWGLRSRWPSNLDSWMTVYWSLLSSTTRQRQFPGNFRFCFSWVCKGSRCWISKANGRNVVEAFSQELPKEDSCTHDRHVNWFALSIWALYFKCWFSSVEKDTAKPKCWWEVLKIESVLWFGDLVCQTRAKRLKS